MQFSNAHLQRSISKPQNSLNTLSEPSSEPNSTLPSKPFFKPPFKTLSKSPSDAPLNPFKTLHKPLCKLLQNPLPQTLLHSLAPPLKLPSTPRSKPVPNTLRPSSENPSATWTLLASEPLSQNPFAHRSNLSAVCSSTYPLQFRARAWELVLLVLSVVHTYVFLVIEKRCSSPVRRRSGPGEESTD